ncbi:MAG: hypothetical protein WEB53_02105 [Akkermansiaceae bacterium]
MIQIERLGGADRDLPCGEPAGRRTDPLGGERSLFGGELLRSHLALVEFHLTDHAVYKPEEENRTADGRRLTQIIKELHRLSVSPSG